MKKTIVTISGIRPDFIRMSKIYAELDKNLNFHHILIHTGQHYDQHLCDVFFKELDIRAPDYILNMGKECSDHFEQLSYLTREIPKLFKAHQIIPDLIMFLGDSNSTGIAAPLKKAGYKIGHIEAGMRSYDKRMLEEINRTICDYCSDILFVYHEDYKLQLAKENITKNVFVVGNTIMEPLLPFRQSIMQNKKRKDMILLDIHRPENFKFPHRLQTIIKFANNCIATYGLPVNMLYFKRLKDELDANSIELGKITMIPLLPYQEYLEIVYHSLFIISDSGTGQEEPALLNTPVVVPRDFTERPQSYTHNCSIPYCVELDNTRDVYNWLADIEEGRKHIDVSWLGDGTTSKQIIDHLNTFLHTENRVKTINVSTREYLNRQPYPYYVQDTILAEDFARDLQKEILNIPVEAWDRYKNPFEQKWTLRNKYTFPIHLTTLFQTLESEPFVKNLSAICGYPLYLDPTRNFWGVHKYDNGDKLDIHVDAGLHPETGQKKQVVFGIYLSVNWHETYGCPFEIWSGDNAVSNEAQIYEKIASVEPVFNRMLLFTCNDYSWHGNPEPVAGPANAKRIFITISYLSENYEDKNTRCKAFFVARPGEPKDREKDILRLKRADMSTYQSIYRVEG